MVIFNELIGLLWLIFVVYWVVSAIGVKKNIEQRGAGWFRWLLIIVVFVLVGSKNFRSFIVHHSFNFSHPAVQAIGVILCAAGIALAIWARRHIGRNWGMPMTKKEGAELTTTGPYKFVRNPIYSGVFLAMIGTAIVVSPWWLLIFIFYASYFFYSAKVEEKIMLEKFPDTYPAYRQRTKMFIPFLF